MGDLLTLHFWFNYYYIPLSDRAKIILLVFASVLVLGVLVMFFLKKKNDLYFNLRQSLFSFFVTNLIISVFIGFFIYEEVPVLSSHFWLLLWLVEMVIWAVKLIKSLKKLPQIKKRVEEQKKFSKYLPK